METATHAVQDRLDQVSEAYEGPEGHPMEGYVAVLAAYGVAAAGLLGAAALTGRLRDGLRPGDLVLYGVATHKLARTVTKDSVTTPIRAPFTRYAGRSGPAEIHERVRVTGWRKAIGELLTCPFCTGQWIATGFVAGSMFLPKATRTVASIFAVRAAADWLQFGYAMIEQAAEKPEAG
jgi:hypothetical protein